MQNVLTKFMESRQFLSLYERASKQHYRSVFPKLPGLPDGAFHKAAETQRQPTPFSLGLVSRYSARTQCVSCAMLIEQVTPAMPWDAP